MNLARVLELAEDCRCGQEFRRHAREVFGPGSVEAKVGQEGLQRMLREFDAALTTLLTQGDDR